MIKFRCATLFRTLSFFPGAGRRHFCLQQSANTLYTLFRSSSACLRKSRPDNAGCTALTSTPPSVASHTCRAVPPLASPLRSVRCCSTFPARLTMNTPLPKVPARMLPSAGDSQSEMVFSAWEKIFRKTPSSRKKALPGNRPQTLGCLFLVKCLFSGPLA